MSLANPKSVLGAVAAAVVVARAKDARLVPRLVLERDGSAGSTIKIWTAALGIYGYEKVVAAILRKLGLTKIPSTLAAMLSLFSILRAAQKAKSREFADELSKVLKPGVDFLGKWMGLFLAPPLVSLDASIARLPPYQGSVWGNATALLSAGWAMTHAAAAAVASSLVPRAATAVASGKAEPTANAPATNGAAGKVQNGQNGHVEEVSQEEAVRRAWVLLGAVGYLGVSCSAVLPPVLHRPLGMLCEMSTTVGSFALSKLLPESVTRVLHPLVICAVSSNMASRFAGAAAPYRDGGSGVGDRLFQMLPAAVTGLGVRMYNTTDKWLDNPEDFRCVLATCGASGCFSMLLTTVGAVSSRSPLSVPAPLSLPMLHRSVMSALGIEGSMAIGPECDPQLAVASILITGCIGASLGNALLRAVPQVFSADSALVRGVAMGCSAHSIGTAGLISEGDTDAAAISGASMCLAGTVHTLVLSLPGVVPTIRAVAQLPAAAA